MELLVMDKQEYRLFSPSICGIRIHYYGLSLSRCQADLVAKMKPEHFPPMEDVISQKEASTNFYILVTGAADIIMQENGIEKVVGEAKAGDIVGEISVICYRPQLFTVRTKRLCQLLRLNRTAFLNIANSNVGDGTIIMCNFLKHLKESSDPMMREILAEAEVMFAQGKIDWGVSLCFAANRGDDLLVRQLLNSGVDPNETDIEGRTPLHIAASIGNQKCVILLLQHRADPNKRDSIGSVPLWEAMLGGHELVTEILKKNGGNLSCADVGHLACCAVEQNNLELLKEFVRCGGDVTQPRSSGRTALHTAVNVGNIEIVELLSQQGAGIDKPDADGQTPRTLANQRGHKNIIQLFKGKRIPPTTSHAKSLRMYPSEPTIGSTSATTGYDNLSRFPARVYVSCPGKEECVVLLPKSLEELIDFGVREFNFSANKILTKQDGAKIKDIRVIRDNDHLILAHDGALDGHAA